MTRVKIIGPCNSVEELEKEVNQVTGIISCTVQMYHDVYHNRLDHYAVAVFENKKDPIHEFINVDQANTDKTDKKGKKK